MNRAQKQSQIQTMFIETTLHTELMEEIEECREDSKLGGTAKCMLVTGDSGAGKTTLIEEYMRTAPRQEETDRSVVPVLFTSLPENATPELATQKMLEDLGDPFPYEQSKIGPLKQQLLKLFVECKVEMIILDEFQQAIESRSAKVLYEVAEWLKKIMIDANIPIIFFGMPYSKAILSVSSQLRKRIIYQRKIPPFRIKNEADLRYYVSFLDVLDSALPFPEKSGLASADIIYRIYAFSLGNMRSIRNLINDAGKFALKDDASKIEYKHLKKAAGKLLVEPQINPFELEFIAASDIEEPSPDVGWNDYQLSSGTPIENEHTKQGSAKLNSIF